MDELNLLLLEIQIEDNINNSYSLSEKIYFFSIVIGFFSIKFSMKIVQFMICNIMTEFLVFFNLFRKFLKYHEFHLEVLKNESNTSIYVLKT